VFVEASLLLHLFLVQRCEEGLPIEKFNFSFFCNLAHAVTRLGDKPDKVLHAGLWEARRQYYLARESGLPIPDRTLRNILNHHLARVLETSMKNHISLNFVQRLKKWVRTGIMNAFPLLPARTRDVYVAALLAAIAADRDWIDVQARNEEEQLLLEHLLATARQGHQNLLPLSEDRLKARWQEYIRWTYEISKDLAQVYTQTRPAQDEQRRQGQPVTGPRLKNLLFSVAPCAAYRAHYAHFDQGGFEVGTEDSPDYNTGGFCCRSEHTIQRVPDVCAGAHSMECEERVPPSRCQDRW